MPNGKVDLQIKGLSELDARLRDLPKNLQSKAMRQAVGAGARVIRDDARSRVHNKSGDLSKAIRFTTKLDVGAGTATAKLFVSVKKAWYGRLVEFGTLPHLIVGGRFAKSVNRQIRNSVFGNNRKVENRFQFRTADKRAKALNILGHFVEKVNHPGAAPKPFLAPAAETKYPAAINAMADKLRAFLDKYKG